MSDSPGRRKRRALFWIGCLVFASFAAGLWAAATPAIGPFVRPAAAVLVILGGLVLLSPFATSRPSNEPQRKARRRISIIATAFILYGIAQAVPSVTVRVSLMGLPVLLMVAAACGFPKRLFAPRP